jgi:hypothetical protein
MARISLHDLVRVLSEHPEYYERWHKDVPARQALEITFTEEMPERPLVAETFDAADGSTIALARDSEGRVWGVEVS